MVESKKFKPWENINHSMSFQSLKFKIAGNLAVIILLSVLLSDVVIVNIIQKSLIQERISSGRQFLALLSDLLQDGSGIGTKLSDGSVEQIFNDSSVLYLYIRFNNGMDDRFGDADSDLQKKIVSLAAHSIKKGRAEIDFFADTFGVFWHQKKYALVSEPVFGVDGEKSGVAIVAVCLDPVFQILRHSQKIIVLYVIANFIILLLFGVYRLSRLIIRPLHRFIKMTDDFREKDRLYFTHGQNYQEFNQLSNALNHMVATIETDKDNLQQSLKELEKVNAELKNAQHEIIKAEKLASVGRLSAGIAHEIGNPIGIVLGYLDLLKSRPNLKNDADGQDFLKRAQDEINRINTVIRQLLDFSRSSSVDCKRTSMHDLIRDVVAMMSGQPLMSHIKIECRLDANIADFVNIDGDQIRQVLINLLINAADSIKVSENKSHGTILVISESMPRDEKSAFKNQPAFLLKVIDNGSGIAGEDIDYIFDPFFTTKAPGKGTGLGLSVSYMIIERAGGRIFAESEIEQGTTMIIMLPLSIPHALFQRDS